MVRSQEQEDPKEDSRRDSTVKDNRECDDSRRDSKEPAIIGLTSYVDKRRYRLRRHSRRYYVDRKKRWVDLTDAVDDRGDADEKW